MSKRGERMLLIAAWIAGGLVFVSMLGVSTYLFVLTYYSQGG